MPCVPRYHDFFDESSTITHLPGFSLVKAKGSHFTSTMAEMISKTPAECHKLIQEGYVYVDVRFLSPCIGCVNCSFLLTLLRSGLGADYLLRSEHRMSLLERTARALLIYRPLLCQGSRPCRTSFWRRSRRRTPIRPRR